MKRMRVIMAMAMGLTLTANAGDLAIQSFDGTGQLSFNRVAVAMTYRVHLFGSDVLPGGRDGATFRHGMDPRRNE
jgi:hypothetical protein